MPKETIYVIGHKSPDTDTVCSAIAYAGYLNKKRVKAEPAVAGEINPETKFVLDYFKVKTPKILETAAGLKLTLVDHNEKSQSPDGTADARIVEIIDHHKMAFEYAEPIYIHTEPVGSTATIIGKVMLADKKFKISRETAGILVSAILSDTVVFKSPTTTKEDIETAKKLAVKARIKNLKKFGIEVKKQKASLKGLSAEQIIRSDFKEFAAGGKKFAIGQIEVVDLAEAKERKQEIFGKMDEIQKQNNYDFAALMETDIINGGTELLVSGNPAPAEKAFGIKLENNSAYVKGMMSRKKDAIPPLMKALGN